MVMVIKTYSLDVERCEIYIISDMLVLIAKIPEEWIFSCLCRVFLKSIAL